MIAWGDAIEGRHSARLAAGDVVRVGVLRGEGVGPEVIAAATDVLVAACHGSGHRLELDRGPDPAGEASSLTEAAADFCRRTFAGGGAVLTGPHGGRWVYELRQRLDLFCKISPLLSSPAIPPSAAFDRIPGRRKPGDVDVLVVREQSAGVYQGRWSETDGRQEGHVAEHSFSYSTRQVRRILEVAVRLAAARRGRLAVVVKRAGVPSISRLWVEVAAEVALRSGVTCETLDIDYAVYAMLRDPGDFDVIAAPNLFGDVLADAGGLLLGSRGLCFGASFDAGMAAVYQTNHGSAHDLAGTDRANPGAQILAAAALLRQSFGLDREAGAIERALSAVWAAGHRTEDLAEGSGVIVGTRELGKLVARRVELDMRAPQVADASRGR